MNIFRKKKVDVTVINDSFKIETVTINMGNDELVSIYVIIDDKREFILKKSINYFCSLYFEYDSNYIVFYTTRYGISSILSCVEVVYDIKNKRTIKLDNKKSFLFKYMYIDLRTIDPKVILQYINDCDLELTSNDNIESFEEYITGGNKNISKEEVINYIFEKYPVLKEYTNISGPLSVKKYDELLKEMDIPEYGFHIIKQIIE